MKRRGGKRTKGAFKTRAGQTAKINLRNPRRGGIRL